MLNVVLPSKLSVRRGLVLSTLLLLLATGRGTATPSPGILCTSNATKEKWTLHAEQAPLLALLSTLATRAGFALTGALPPGDPRITIQVDQVPLDQVLRSVLKQGQCNYCLVYRGDRLHRIVLIGKDLQWASFPQISPAAALSEISPAAAPSEGPPAAAPPEGPPAAAVKPAQPVDSSRLAPPPGEMSRANRRALQRARSLRERSSALSGRGQVGDSDEESEWHDGGTEE